MKILHLTLIFFTITSSLFVFLSSNPVHSVLFLILTFCNASIILFLFNVDFLGLLFIIIYVGAIAILFLFVVMMLNVKVYSSSLPNYWPLIFLVFIFFILQIFFFTEQIYSNFELRLNNIFTFENNLDILYSIDLIGQSLYNYFMLCFLIAGLILLVALIGAIVLTLRFISIRESELVSRQLSRSDNFLAFFK